MRGKTKDDKDYLPFLACFIAQDTKTPLLADDRVCQAFTLNEIADVPRAAFGSDVVALSLMAAGKLEPDKTAAAIGQLMAWRYRFIVPPPETLKLLADQYRGSPPGQALQRVAEYVHDCMRDTGLFGGPENTEIKDSMAMRLYLSWVSAIAEFLILMWADEGFSPDCAIRLTEWSCRELLPSCPRVVDGRMKVRVGALPIAVESPADPTYAQECALGDTAMKWAICQPEDQRKTLVQLVDTSRTLGSVEGLCKALREMAEKSLADQVAVALALKAGAYTDPALAPAVWEVVSDAEWRQSVLGTVEERVLGLVIEALAVIQADAREQWFSLFPHYIAELCEKTDNDERRRQMFLYVLHTSSASDTVSAVRRLLRGDQKARFTKFVQDYRTHVEAMWKDYPSWVQGRLRGLLANLHGT